MNDIAGKASEIIGIDSDLMWSKGKQPKVVQARSLLCYWASHELGKSQSALSKKLGVSPSAVSLAVARGRDLIREHGYGLRI